MNQPEKETSQPLTCAKCNIRFIDFAGGNCNHHKFCKGCVNPSLGCYLCNLISFSDEDEEEETPDGNQDEPKDPVINVQGQQLKPDNTDGNREERKRQVIVQEEIFDEFLQGNQLLQGLQKPRSTTVLTAPSKRVESKTVLRENKAISEKLVVPHNGRRIKKIAHEEKQDDKDEDRSEPNDEDDAVEQQQRQGKAELEKMKAMLEQMQNRLQENQKMHFLQKQNYIVQLSLLKAQIKAYKQRQRNDKNAVEQHLNKMQVVKRLINSYYKLLIRHFQQISNNYSYGLAMEKIKMVKMLIDGFNNIAQGNIHFAGMITVNQELINHYIEADIQKFKMEIEAMVISFNLFAGDSGNNLKILLQKLKLYKEVLGAVEVVQDCENKISHKINHFLKTVVSKNISNNRTSKNQYIIIQYLNQFLKFQENFKEEAKIISEKCSASWNIVYSHLQQNFKKIQNMYLSLGLGNSQNVKALHSKEDKINIMIKMIINIRVITKNNKYRLHFEKQTKRNINDFKDQINRALILMRNTLSKEINRKDTVNDYNKNYEYFRSLPKIKDFDTIWDAEENFYHNFKFQELYEMTKTRNDILKKVKIHQIHQMLNEQGFDSDALSLQIDEIVANQQMRSVLVCRIKEIFTKKLSKMSKLSQFSLIGFGEMDQFKQFYFDVTELEKIINPMPIFESHIDFENYYNIINVKIDIISRFLFERFNYLLENYNSQEFEQIEKEIKYYASFQEFFKEHLNDKYKQLKRQVKNLLNSLNIQKKKSIFDTLAQLIQESKQFIATFVQSSQISEGDYDKIKKFRKAFTSNQEELIEKKIDKNIERRIAQLQNEQWQKGYFESNVQIILRQNIQKLTSNQQNKYRQKLKKLREQIQDKTNKKIEEIQVKLAEEENYIIDTLLPLIRNQQNNKSAYAKRYVDILSDYLNLLLDKQFKQISKRSRFLDEYIYKVSLSSQKSLRIRQLYASLQYKTYKIQSQNIPTLITNIMREFKQPFFISKKAVDNAEELDQLINLYVFFRNDISRTLLTAKTVQSIKLFFESYEEEMKAFLAQIINQIDLNKQIQQLHSQQILMTKIVKAKILYNLLIKFSQTTDQMTKVPIIIKSCKEQLIRWADFLKNYSFSDTLSKSRLSDAQIIADLQKTDMIAKRLVNVEEYYQRNVIILANRVVNLDIFQIKLKDLTSNLQQSWKEFYSANISDQLAGIFNINQKISQKCQMFIRVKNAVKVKRMRTFSFITNEQYDIKRYLVQEGKKICHQTERLIKQCNDEYSRYIIEIKDKKTDTEKRLELEKQNITKFYQEKIQVINAQITEIGSHPELQQEVVQKQAKIDNIKKARLKEISQVEQQYKKIIDQLDGFCRGKIGKLFVKIIDNMRIIQKISLEFAQQQIKKSLKKFTDRIYKEIEQSDVKIKDDLIELFYEKRQSCHLVANIVLQNNIFEELRIMLFNEGVKHQDIHYVIKNCPQVNCLSESEKKELAQDFEKYRQEVQNIQKQYKANRSEAKFTQIVNKTIAEALNVSTSVLLGRIFGVESILRIKHKEVLKFIRNPHPAQIIAILLLIRPGKNANKLTNLSNGMAQVKTGEGKSIVLAGLCSVLAMRDCYAYCACYSSYLSARDEKQYHLLFQTLKVLNKIKYGTFAEHCKDLLDERGKFYFKDVIKECIMEKNQKIDSKYGSYLKRLQSIFQRKDRAKRILIIDQVDVFFQERYFGEFYRPAVSLDFQCMKNLIKFIWEHREQGKSSKNKQQLKEIIKCTNHYQQLITSWSHLSSLLNNQLDGMIAAATNPQHSYQIIDHKIVYRYNDIVQEELNNGLKTVFATCLEKDKHKVSEQFYEKTLKLSLIISQFSYAELPRYFDNILGVSGTLETLAKSRKQIMMQKYNVQGFYILPSIYGAPRRTIYDPMIIEDHYEEVLVNKIIEESSKGRPVMIFFKTRIDMMHVYQSEKVKAYLNDCCFINEDEEEHIRDSTIRLAGRRGRVTFMTSYFSRGTDFRIEDKALIEAGGFHVIQTYISKDESDYVQVYGRTARQGKSGTFQIIIKSESLIEFDINTTDSKKIFGEIKKAWGKRDEVEGEKLQNKIDKASIVHQNSYGVIKSISKGTKNLIQEIQRLNYVKVAAAKNVKSIIAVDGTGSMGGVLKKLKEVIAEAIINTEKIITNNKVNASFEQQLIIYRNYSSLNLILECSGFTNNPLALADWTSHIVQNGGQGNQALEVVFKKMNGMDAVSQIIIIGDARGNTQAEMVEKRNQENSDEKFWNDMNAPFVHSTDAELETLISKKIPIHTLYIPKKNADQNTIIADYFGSISKRTNGVCQAFHVNETNASTILSDFIASSVLNQVGGQQLVDDYFRMRRG